LTRQPASCRRGCAGPTIAKPTELLSLVSGGFNKSPTETWRHYGPLFREYSTASIPPELLAALAQAEGAGNPMASTYWRWHLTWNPFAIYQPASSSVGLYQMTDAAFAEARRYCMRHHAVVEDDCALTGLDLSCPAEPRHRTHDGIIWTAMSPRFSRTGRTRGAAGSTSRSSPR
jgi:hypothetical protein